MTKVESFQQQIALFSRAQFSAFIGGLVDFGVMIGLTQLFGVYYLYSLVVGGIIGAVCNFLINRYWTFDSTRMSIYRQLLKFSFVVFLSITLKSVGTYLLTEYCLVDYRISKLVTDAFVCFVINYTLQKFWVFDS